jgi:hypothetical protein
MAPDLTPAVATLVSFNRKELRRAGILYSVRKYEHDNQLRQD